VDDAGTVAGGCVAEADGGATELVGVGVTEGEGVDAVEVVDESVGEEVETPALPHPTASKATSADAAIFEYLTVR
jgi:hypothetical protein